MPNISNILDRVGTAQYFSIFELTSGFHQIEFDPKDRQKTTFSSLNGHNEYVRMPMGLKNSPATFQRLVDQVLLRLQGTELFVYLDDIIIYAKDLEDHGKKIKRLLKQLKEANLSLQPEKCEFLFKEIAYLGHIISDPKEIEAVQNFPRLKTPRNIKQNLIKKEALFKWGTEEEKIFKDLRQALCESPILQYPDFEKSFTVTTDASDYAIGAVLSQENDGMVVRKKQKGIKNHPPILTKRKSVLLRLNLPPAAYPSSTIPKSTPAKAPARSTEFFPEDQEESTPITGKQETVPIKIVSPPPRSVRTRKI